MFCCDKFNCGDDGESYLVLIFVITIALYNGLCIVIRVLCVISHVVVTLDIIRVRIVNFHAFENTMIIMCSLMIERLQKW